MWWLFLHFLLSSAHAISAENDTLPVAHQYADLVFADLADVSTPQPFADMLQEMQGKNFHTGFSRRFGDDPAGGYMNTGGVLDDYMNEDLVKRRENVQWAFDSNCVTVKESHCFPLKNEFDLKCFAADLPYKNYGKLFDFNNRMDLLERYTSVSGIPKCWKYLRILLCSTVLPPCHLDSDNKARIRLPSREVCETAQDECAFLIRHNMWPEEVPRDCTDMDSYRSACEIANLTPDWRPASKSNRLAYKCIAPLIPIGHEQTVDAFTISGVSDCSLNCSNAWLLSDSQLSLLHGTQFGIVVAVLFFVIPSSLLSLLSWRYIDSMRRPLCFALYGYATLAAAWIIPLMNDGVRRDVMCRTDGSLRVNELATRSAQGLQCLLHFSFVLLSVVIICHSLACYAIRHFLVVDGFMAEVAPKSNWSRITAFLNTTQHRASSIGVIIITFVILLASAIGSRSVDSDGLTGICWSGYFRRSWGFAFSYTLPICSWLITAASLLLCLCRVQRRRPSDQKFGHSFTVPVLLSGLHLTCLCGSLAAHLRGYPGGDHAQRAIEEYLVCRLQIKVAHQDQECHISGQPDVYSVVAMQFCLFSPGFVLAMYMFAVVFPKLPTCITSWCKCCAESTIRWCGSSEAADRNHAAIDTANIDPLLGNPKVALLQDQAFFNPNLQSMGYHGAVKVTSESRASSRHASQTPQPSDPFPSGAPRPMPHYNPSVRDALSVAASRRSNASFRDLRHVRSKKATHRRSTHSIGTIGTAHSLMTTTLPDDITSYSAGGELGFADQTRYPVDAPDYREQQREQQKQMLMAYASAFLQQGFLAYNAATALTDGSTAPPAQMPPGMPSMYGFPPAYHPATSTAHSAPAPISHTLPNRHHKSAGNPPRADTAPMQPMYAGMDASPSMSRSTRRNRSRNSRRSTRSDSVAYSSASDEFDSEAEDPEEEAMLRDMMQGGPCYEQNAALIGKQK